MNFCKRNHLPPAQSWAWNMACEAYLKFKEREEAMEKQKKVRAKHVGYAGQREFCRNNGHTYTEKFTEQTVLMCNYPFPDIHHKKGVCRANTCTDMREIKAVEVPQEIIEADKEEDSMFDSNNDVPNCDQLDTNLAEAGVGKDDDPAPQLTNERPDYSV